VAHAVVDGWWCGGGSGLDAGVEGMQGRVASQGSMRTDLVVIGAEGVELGLEDRQSRCRRLFVEELLLGGVEVLDLAAGLG
jgi:hypothetical protein